MCSGAANTFSARTGVAAARPTSTMAVHRTHRDASGTTPTLGAAGRTALMAVDQDNFETKT
jgi:hypothetical protein